MPSTRVRSKIQRMLEDLEASTDALDAPRRVPGGSETTEQSDDLATEDSDIGDAGRQAMAQYSRAEGYAGGKSGGQAHEQAKALERRVLQLMQEQQAAQHLHNAELAAKAAEVSELQRHLNSLVAELHNRQAEVEARAPLAHLRGDDFRSQLQDLRISSSRYSELKSLPADGLAPLDSVKVAVHEAMADLAGEAERLRKAGAAAREVAARAEEEAARARLETGRCAAALAERERELQELGEGMRARVERLAAELQAASVRAEVSAAKGQMYDELRQRLDVVEAENQRLAVIEATFKRMQAQVAEADASTARRDHTMEMLMMDKAYLSKQVDFMTEAQRKLEADLEVKERQVAELQQAKTELLDRLMAAEVLKGRTEEARVTRDLAALQASTHADLEKIRVETSEAYEREARLLRELRDQAIDEAARLKSSLTLLQGTHDRAVLQATDTQRRLEAQVSELQSELKQRAFELSHFKVVVGEKESLLGRTHMQIELLQNKLTVAMDQVRLTEAEQNTAMARAALSAATTAAVAVTGGGSGGGAERASAPLQVELLVLKQERTQLEAQVATLQARLHSAQGLLQLASQPHAYLMDELSSARNALASAEAQVAVLQAALASQKAAGQQLTVERDGLRRDLDALLAQRQQLAEMKAVMMRALGGGAPGGVAGSMAVAAGTGAGTGIGLLRSPQMQLAPGQTLIVGEGF